MRNLFALVAVVAVVLLAPVSVAAQAIWVGGDSVTSPVGGPIPPNTPMADTGTTLSTQPTIWATIAMCTASQTLEGSPLQAVGGFGRFLFQAYHKDEAGNVTILHKAEFAPNIFHDSGLQSIPPVVLGAGDGLRVVAITGRGVFSCTIWAYRP